MDIKCYCCSQPWKEIYKFLLANYYISELSLTDFFSIFIWTDGWNLTFLLQQKILLHAKTQQAAASCVCPGYFWHWFFFFFLLYLLFILCPWMLKEELCTLLQMTINNGTNVFKQSCNFATDRIINMIACCNLKLKNYQSSK